MNTSSRARPGSSGVWDRARRAYVDLLGDDDPAAALLAVGAVDMRLGYEDGEWDRSAPAVVSGPADLAELADIVEAAMGVGTWPRHPSPAGAAITARLTVARPAPLLGLLLAMEGLIERRSPWGQWRTMVDTMALRVAEIDSITLDLRVVDPVR